MPHHPPIPNFSTSWGEGRFADRWMVVHLLSGVTGGLFNVFVTWTTWQVLGAGVVLMILWELVEMACKIRESAVNRVIDVVVGLVGVGIGLWLTTRVPGATARLLWGAALALTLIGTGLGVRHRAQRRRLRTRAASSP